MSSPAKVSRVLVGVDFDGASASADLIVSSMAAGTDTDVQLGAIVQVLEECVHPVLFVPSASGMFERSSS